MRAPLCPGRGCRAKATGSSASAHSSVNDEGWSRQHSLAASPSNWQNSAASDERSSVASRLGCWAVKCLWFLKNARWLLITGRSCQECSHCEGRVLTTTPPGDPKHCNLSKSIWALSLSWAANYNLCLFFCCNACIFINSRCSSDYQWLYWSMTLLTW